MTTGLRAHQMTTGSCVQARIAALVAAPQQLSGRCSPDVDILSEDPIEPQGPHDDAWSAAHEQLWTAVLNRFGGSGPAKNPVRGSSRLCF